ncbi:rhodanese-like sulfurtransferase [Thermoclostridium stercorarium subsp. stercorarium DSM 8532]|jgi:rhodanese-related sulfurtransferase|uniref:Rhodanese-like sulfurtransferase n=2 Tax=Thermoclostridium stercorarium TaxID=1510 RepID=L7VL77_THES1|nr:rhodanese-like domain-containing protein [Thermoclostridium stercorarium]AGC67226.1 rhodanese-like sulfurtransferase [Thermoclostridium stercorarium subsp. stercorarium DSM 8532]ANW97684.1 sulfurtransferase [Thermoclostridium stercorarium subsp. thermolacticum DSM 2910]
MQIEMVTKEELLTMLNNLDVIVLNVLPRDWYEQAHIKGSISIPLEELPNHLNCLSKDKLIITYCASYECTSCIEAAELLANYGFNVKVYRGGTKEWIEAGLPWESST